jgi:integrase
MGLKRKGKIWYVRFRKGGDEFTASARTEIKTVAQEIDSAIHRAVRTKDPSYLDPDSREVAMRLFSNRAEEYLPGITSTQAPATLTLWEAMRICLSDPEVQAKGKKYRERLKDCFIHLALKLGKDTPVRSIRVSHIKRYMNERVKEESAAEATANREKAALSKVFQILIENDLVERNPVRDVSNLSEKSGLRQVYVSRSDFDKIVDALPPWYVPMVWTAYYTGMRQGEIRKMTRDQLDLEQRVIRLGPSDTKEGKHKRVPIHEDLVPILEEVLAGKVVGLDRVFLKDGQPIRRTQMRRSWEKAVRRAELGEPIRFHDIRHVWKTNARRSGMDGELREDIMGHWNSGKSVNSRYGYISNEELVRAIDGFSSDHGETEVWVAKSKKKNPAGGSAGH